jgi:hypothetical protein
MTAAFNAVREIRKPMERVGIVGDALALSMGAKPRQPRDYAVELAAAGIDAQRAAELLHIRSGAAFSSSDFGLAIDRAIQLVASDSAAISQEHRYSAGMIDLSDFQTKDLPRTAGGQLVRHVENAEQARTSISVRGEPCQLVTFSGGDTISREAILSAQWDHVAAVVRELVAAGFRRERSELIDLLVANAPLADGVPWFDASRGNVAEAVALDAAGLSAGFLALRSLTAGGSVLQLRAGVLWVPAALEVQARTLVAQMTAPGLTNPPQVLADTRLSHVYVLPAPTVAPVVGLAHLRGQRAPTVQSKAELEQDALTVRCFFDLAAVPLSPHAVRLTITG